jgi:hypothetical protein
MKPTPGVLVGRIACSLGWLSWDKRGQVTVSCQLLGEIADELARIGRHLRAGEAGSGG